MGQLQSELGIDRLDVVIANAGALNIYGDSNQVSTQEILELVNINSLGIHTFRCPESLWTD
jgi:NADP-dependent 3-hydroxy acid dehydrogenase YdfG